MTATSIQPAMLSRYTEVQHPHMPTPCWEWSGARTKDGYGCTRLDGKVQYVHRLSYVLFVGELLFGQVVRHMCDNRCCFNPRHLESGTQQENVRDMFSRKRHPWSLKSGWKMGKVAQPLRNSKASRKRQGAIATELTRK